MRTRSSIFIPICTLSVVSTKYYHMASGWREAKLPVGYKLQQVPGRQLSFHGATKQIFVDLSIMAENLF